MDLVRHFLSTSVVVVLAVVGVAPALAAQYGVEGPAVYYVSHTISSEAAEDGEVSNIGYYRADLHASRRGSAQLELAPLWTRQVDASGVTRYLLDLQPGTDDEVLDVLTDGFAAPLTKDGEPGPLRAIDQNAWSVLTKASPNEAGALLATYQAPGLRPVPLPASVAVGDRISGWQRIEPYGALKTTLRVIEVTDTAVLMGMTLDGAGAGAHGEGRLVVQRVDGMPIELRMEVNLPGSKGQPATRHRVHLADMRHDLMLQMADEVESYVSYVEQINQQLARPPFSAPSPASSAYTHHPAPLGALEDYMVGAEVLPALAPHMGSLWIPAETGSGRWLAIGARMPASTPAGARRSEHEPMLMSRLHTVELLDAQAAPIIGLESRLVTPTLFLSERYSAAQNELSFPFHLPLGASRALLGQVEAVRMSVDAEVYAFDTSETLEAGALATRNPDATLLRPSAHRVTLVQGRQTWKQKTGLYTVVVPLDVDGNLMPSEQISVAPLKPAQPTRLAELPLAWENSTLPIRTEIATPGPIARLQVRHYRWTSIPVQWTFPMYP